MNTKHLLMFLILIFSSFVNAYDNIDKRIAKEIYVQEMDDGLDDSCIYRNDDYVSENTRNFLGVLRSSFYTKDHERKDFDGIDINLVIDDFKKLYSRIDSTYCFNPSKCSYGLKGYRAIDESNKAYVYFYLLYESLNEYERITGINVGIPEFDTNFVCKKYKEFQNYTYTNKRSHYDRASHENLKIIDNLRNARTQTEKDILPFVELYEDCIVDDVPIDILLAERSQAEELGLLFDDQTRDFCKGYMYGYVKNEGKPILARHDTKYRVKEIVPVRNSYIKLIHVVDVGTEKINSTFSTKVHHGYIPSNVWDGLRKVKIEEELNLIKEAEHKKNVVLELQALRNDLLNEEKKLKSELKLVKKELKSENKFLKNNADDISAISKKTTKDNINTLSKKQKEIEKELGKLNVKIIDLNERISEETK